MRGVKTDGLSGGWIEHRALLLSPLLNLAPARGSGPRMNHVAPLVPLGAGRLGGTASLSLSPDRCCIEVTACLDGAAPLVQIRRLARRHLDGAAAAGDEELLVLLLSARQGRERRPGAAAGGASVKRRLSLAHRHAFLRLPWSAELSRLGIDPSALDASAIAGVAVERASQAPPARALPFFEGASEPMRLHRLAERSFTRRTAELSR